MCYKYTNCYIAFIDILGFKNIIKTKSCEEIHDIFINQMKNPITSFYQGRKNITDIENIKTKVMSDSICFFIDSKIRNSLISLINVCDFFQNSLLERSEPILSRGAIVKGDIFANEDIVYGPGFVEAYLMEENNAKYPRIIMTRETIKSAIENTDKDICNLFNNLVFFDEDNFFAIDNFDRFEGFDISGNKCRSLLKHIDNILKTSDNDSISEKYMYLKKNLFRWYHPEEKECQNNQQQ